MNRKKILFVDDQIYKLYQDDAKSTGGAAIQTYNWMKGFEAVGFKVAYTSPVKTSGDAVYLKHLRKGPRYVFWLLHLFDYYREVKKFNPSIIYLSTAGWKTSLWLIISRLVGAQYVQRISNNIVFNAGIYRKHLGVYRYGLAKLGVKGSDLILCQNEFQRSIIRSLFPRVKTEVIYNPYLLTNEIDNSNQTREYVAWIGLFQYQKNLPGLLHIVLECQDILFKIAGEPAGVLDNETIEALEKLKKLRNVEFVGFLDRVSLNNFLKNSLCLLNTSHYEGFSNTFLEAFSTSTPVITRIATDPDGIIQRNNLGFATTDYDEIPSLIKGIKSANLGRDERFSVYLNHEHNPEILAKKVLHCLTIVIENHKIR
jgi:glycosyltransferase involved in cell wall biosynthesis